MLSDLLLVLLRKLITFFLALAQSSLQVIDGHLHFGQLRFFALDL